MDFDFPHRLRQARTRANLTQLDVASALGITASTYCGYETGKRQPDVRRLHALAQLLHASGDELLGLAPVPAASPALSDEERHLVLSYRALDEHGRRLVRLVAEAELAHPRQAAPTPSVLFRISEQPAAAGYGTYLGPDAFRTARVRRAALPRGAAFGVPVRGDSMEPRYHDGDILVVSNLLPEPGDIGVFIMDGAGYVKRMGAGELLSLNPAYAPIQMTESIRACGKVIGILRDEDFLS